MPISSWLAGSCLISSASPNDPSPGHTDPIPPYRDVAAFNDRAAAYDRGWRGRLHHEIADRTASLALATVAAPNRVLDLGWGTGYLLQALAGRYRNAEQLVGIDAAPEMVKMAGAVAQDDRLTFAVGVAEDIGYPDETFDLMGLAECARVLRPGAHLVLVDQFSWWLTPTLLTSRRGKARTRRRATRLLLRAGFCSPH